MKELAAEFEKLRARSPAGFESSLVIPCLRRIQEKRGFVADEDIADVVAWHVPVAPDRPPTRLAE